jgi:hypothetical protein
MNQETMGIYTQFLSKTAGAAEHKKILSRIVLDEINSEEKIAKIKRSVLQYHAYEEEKEEKIATNDKPHELYELTLILDTLKELFLPLDEHNELLGKIKIEAVAVGRKVDMISNLLI